MARDGHFRLDANIVSRGKGHSAVAKAAYRSGAKFNDERLGRSWDYSGKQDVIHSEIIAPADAPDWALDREKLWNEVEKFESRKDAQLSRTFDLSLPRELDSEQQLEAARNFANREFVSKGYVVDLNFHNPPASDGGEQPHCHMMVTMRRVDKSGFCNERKPRDMNNTNQLEQWRKAWADDENVALEKAGLDVRVDHRSLEVRREEALQNGYLEKAAELDRMPQGKQGAAATGIKRDGRKSRRAEFQDQIKADNQERQTLAKEVINTKLDVQNGKLSRADAGNRLEKLAEDASKKADFWKSKGSRIGERHWSSLSSQLKIDAQSTRLGPGLGQAAEKIGGGGKTGKASAGAALRPGKPKLPGTGGGGGGGDEVDKLVSQTSSSIKKVAEIMAKAASAGLPSPGGAAGAIAKSIIKPGLGRRL
ncbi:MAG: MobA/MobL family protein [Alphaproteobacteria bacterium]|nr:MobA/MobL family protein [Alphaproteobacteria bacterium]